MCGLAGILDLRSSKNNDISLLKNMSDVIIHRGPDSEGQWISEDRSVGFSHRRLSIVDLSENGSQPMHSRDGRFTIAFNGEIYNHFEIRKELLEKGYTFKGNSDTETLLYAYVEYGPSILDKLIGMWAIAIWDNFKKELFLCRDKIGIKPLYFYQQDSLFVFASEIKAILKHPDVKKEFNIDELPNYLNFGMSSSIESLFKNIKKVPSANYFLIDEKGKLDQKEYWSPLSTEYTQDSVEEIQTNVLNRLRDSVDIRMMSDVPFGVFLSGGIDSSLNVALMSELMNRPVDTFTVGFKELEKFNELKYARVIADKFNTNHHEILIDENDAFPILSDLAWHEDEPNADPVCIPLYFLSKLTKDSGTTVIQVGEGSDEQFVGYKWMLQGYDFYKTWWKYFHLLPQSIRKIIFNLIKPAFKSADQFLALDYLRRAAYGEEFNWSGVSIYSPSHQEQLLNKEYRHLKNIPAKYGQYLHNWARKYNKDAEYLQRILFVELKQRLAEILLMRVDKIGMAHSLEARVPFLDHRLVEYTMSIPDSKKVNSQKEAKYLLKKAVEGILPHDIIYRKKMGFAAPVDNWFRDPWYKFAEDRLLHSEFSKLGIFNNDFLSGQLKKHKEGKKNNGASIYSLVNLSLWYDRYFK